MEYIFHKFPLALLMYLVAARAEYAYHRSHYRAEQLWCKVVECDQGEEAELCSRGLPETTRCVPCDPGMFMKGSTRSTEGRRCRNKRVCSRNEGLISWRENGLAKNRQCLCNTIQGYYSMDFDPDDPDYSTENCVYCPWNDSYIDTDRGCSTCHGYIYLDSGGYKRCKRNTSTPAETPIPSVPDVQSDRAVAGELEESSTNSKNSYSSLQIGVIFGVVVGLILVAVTVAILVRRQWISRQNRHRNRRMRPETPPLHVARPLIDVTPDFRPVLAETYPSASRPQIFTHPLHQATGSGSPTTSFNLISDGPLTTERDGAISKDPGAKPAEKGGGNIHCVNYIANGNYVKVRGDYTGMSAKGNIENSVISQRLANCHKIDSSAVDPTTVTINLQPATEAAHSPNENLSEYPETIQSVVECTARPIQVVDDTTLPPSKPVAGTSSNENTIPKQY